MGVQNAVFVRSIDTKESGEVVATASNGSPEGPPFIRFALPRDWVERCHIGKRYSMTVEEWD